MKEKVDAPCPSARVIMLKVVDSETKAPLAGTVFELIHKGAVKAIATTGKNGAFFLDQLKEGDYELVETTPAPGYSVIHRPLSISVNCAGCSAINGVPADIAVVENTTVYR